MKKMDPLSSEHFVATCPRECELLLKDEIEAHGGKVLKTSRSTVRFVATLEVAYRLVYWSRLANRIFLSLSRFPYAKEQDVYDGVSRIQWSEYFNVSQSLKIGCTLKSSILTNSHYVAQLSKDAICDQFRRLEKKRPDVDLKNPDVRVQIHLDQKEVSVLLDLCGRSLHERGYRIAGVQAPMKENLAAAILIRAGLLKNRSEISWVMDPLCGSGTFLFETYLMWNELPSGLFRKRFGLMNWKFFDKALWEKTVREGTSRWESVKERKGLSIYGYDQDAALIGEVKKVLTKFGIENAIHVEKRDLLDWGTARFPYERTGLIVTNPPYGERLGDNPELIELYTGLGTLAKEKFQGSFLSLFTANPALGKTMGIRAHKIHKFFNGPLECSLLNFNILEKAFVRGAREGVSESEPKKALPKVSIRVSESSLPFKNRLEKNLKKFAPLAKQGEIEGYRLYDGDIKEFNVAVDLYRDYAVVQEYVAPRSIDPKKSEERLKDILILTGEVLGLDPSHVVLKKRQIQRENFQYEKETGETIRFFLNEGGSEFLVDLRSYLDTGIYFDSRNIRKEIKKEAKGRRFLNLFCYTGTATVYAAAGGSPRSTSVDHSSTYLDWAKENFKRNGLSRNHELVRSDIIDFLGLAAKRREKYDLIFLDPPTFSHSKKRGKSFDLQKDHVELVQMCKAVMSPNGVLYFSNHFRQFEIDEEGLRSLGFRVQNQSSRFLPFDFKKNPKIFRVWRLDPA